MTSSGFKAAAGSIKKPSAITIESNILALDAEGNPIEGVSFLVKSTDGETGEIKEQVFVSDENGRIFLQMYPDQEYEFIASKDGYRNSTKRFSTEGMYNNNELDLRIDLVDEDCLAVTGTVNGLEDALRLGNAKITLKNLCTNEETHYTSNLIGDFTIDCIDPNCSYEIYAEKDNYQRAAGKISISTAQKEFIEKINLVLNLKSAGSGGLASNGNGNNNSNNNNNNNSNYNGNSGLGSYNNSNVYNGSVPSTSNTNTLELEEIFYDFDKYEIRPDAARVLDELVAILRTYPEMQIELSAHTDAQGSDRYNKRLSRKRAEYATWYLLKKGIKKNRLQYQGFGESQIRNHCVNGTACSDQEHEYNRRTMIKILD